MTDIKLIIIRLLLAFKTISIRSNFNKVIILLFNGTKQRYVKDAAAAGCQQPHSVLRPKLGGFLGQEP
jgi:hypothetical protein